MTNLPGARTQVVEIISPDGSVIVISVLSLEKLMHPVIMQANAAQPNSFMSFIENLLLLAKQNVQTKKPPPELLLQAKAHHQLR
jgi:hypothetical protein